MYMYTIFAHGECVFPLYVCIFKKGLRRKRQGVRGRKQTIGVGAALDARVPAKLSVLKVRAGQSFVVCDRDHERMNHDVELRTI